MEKPGSQQVSRATSNSDNMADPKNKVETSSDVKAFDFGIFKKGPNKNKNEKVLEEPPDVNSEIPTSSSVEPDDLENVSNSDLYYNMNGRKLMAVFNYNTYQATKYYNYTAPSGRPGTDEDVTKIKEVFGDKLGFEIVIYKDLNYKRFWEEIIKLQKLNYTGYSCLSIVILTHGGRKGELFAADRPFKLDDVLHAFIGILVGKPKVFFIQACRGKAIDDGIRVSTDGVDKEIYKLPSHCDFLVLRSSVEDYLSYRDNRGSWLIQELCKAIEDHHEKEDLLHIIIRMNKKIAEDYYTFTYEYKTHNKKQTPETTFTLTKFLKFNW